MAVEPKRGEIRQHSMGRVRPRIRRVAASTLILLCAACGGPANTSRTSSASCVGPYLNDQPPSGVFRGPVQTVSPGDSITLYGHWYTSTCNDTGGHDPLEPLPPVHLTLTLPGGAVEDLGESTPKGQDMGFSTAVQVPTGTSAGTATVRDDQQDPETYKFEVGK
jgi:hypothetical protein